MQFRCEDFRLPAIQEAVSKSKRGREPDNRCRFWQQSRNNEIKLFRYLNIYEGVHTDVIYTNRFDEGSDLSTTYLGRMTVTMDTKIKVEEKFPIPGQDYTLGKLLDGMKCQILLDTGASKSYMSKSFYLRCQTLHAFKHTENTGQKWSICGCTVSITNDSSGHMFEIFTLVSEIHENVDLVLGIKNIFKLEGFIDSCDSCFSFLNKSISFFPKEKGEIKPKEQKLVEWKHHVLKKFQEWPL